MIPKHFMLYLAVILNFWDTSDFFPIFMPKMSSGGFKLINVITSQIKVTKTSFFQT